MRTSENSDTLDSDQNFHDAAVLVLGTACPATQIRGAADRMSESTSTGGSAQFGIPPPHYGMILSQQAN